ncbi:MAG TPA: hypothetical protein VFW96_15920 [Thermomicrobiales bacterium]|nr:hypothetical protein [Thermomicrobiales bacterium]
MALNFTNFGFGRQHDSPPEDDAAAEGRRTPMQTLFLDRLSRLVQKIQLHGRYLAPTDRRMQLLNRAIFATFCTCRDLGLEREARTILAALHADHDGVRVAPDAAPARDPGYHAGARRGSETHAT